MRVLVVGSGAREHALVWKLAGEPNVTDIVCAPGNPGIGGLARCVEADLGRPRSLVDIADREAIDLTIVGPEGPLALGIADLFKQNRLRIVGPTRAAARLESSKVYAKTFMARHAIPTADFLICDSPGEAFRVLDSGRFGYPVVVKADGLAAGKGVTVASDAAEARAAIQALMIDQIFGPAGIRLVIERCLTGEEASFFALCDGRDAVPLGSAQDHKRAFDGDSGPNTGGMGAFAPSPLVTPEVIDLVLRRVVGPTLEGLAEEGCPYAGILYVGLMLTAEGPMVIEYNVRFGDPEAQVILPGLEGDVLPAFLAAAEGRLGSAGLRAGGTASAGVPAAIGSAGVPAGGPRSAGVPAGGPGVQPHVGIVLASGGYPGTFATGKAIKGLAEAAAQPDVLVFQAGTAWSDGEIVTAGGRVLTVVARGATYGDAIDRAYAAAGSISFEGMHYRRDIGHKAV